MPPSFKKYRKGLAMGTVTVELGKVQKCREKITYALLHGNYKSTEKAIPSDLLLTKIQRSGEKKYLPPPPGPFLASSPSLFHRSPPLPVPGPLSPYLELDLEHIAFNSNL